MRSAGKASGRPNGAGMVAAAAIVAVLAAACAGDVGGSEGGPGDLDVVTAFYALEFAARRVGGDVVRVSNLTPPGGEPHDLELKPSDVRRVEGADLVLYFAGGFQPALDDAIAKFSDGSRAVDLLSRLELRPPTGEEEHAGEEGAGHEEEPAVDPHVWLSPPMMGRIVDSIAAALAARIPADKGGIEKRASALRAELEALDAEFESKLATCRRREIFTSHAAFTYLAAQYGLRQVPITGLSPEAEPTAARLQEVARLASGARATTIFFETLVSPRVSEAVARTVGAGTAVLDPLEGLTPEEAAEGADYFSVMRTNLTNLVEALGCSPP